LQFDRPALEQPFRTILYIKVDIHVIANCNSQTKQKNEKNSYVLHQFSGPFFLLLLEPFPLPVDVGECVPEPPSVAPGKAAVAAVEAGSDSGTGVRVAEDATAVSAVEAATTVSAVEAATAVTAVEAAEDSGKVGSAAAVEAD
jgi:hypothetical protein